MPQIDNIFLIFQIESIDNIVSLFETARYFNKTICNILSWILV